MKEELAGPRSRGLPPEVGAPGPTAWHHLDPLTRLTLSVATVVSTIALGGVAGPLVLALLAVVLPALVARTLGRVIRIAGLLALPLALSAAIVNVLFPPDGGRVLADLGPLRITSAGLAIALEVAVRVLVMAGAVTLFYVTTRPAELVASLQAHGLPARATFVVHNAVAMIPRLAERAAEVTSAQRARGLDSEGSLVRRLRGVAALAVPMVTGAISETEARTIALESRAFTRPGQRALLWQPQDGTAQRVLRWGLVIAVGGIIVLRGTGWQTPW